MTAMNEATHEIRPDGMVWLPPPKAVAMIYDATPIANNMRRFFVNRFKAECGSETALFLKNFHKEFKEHLFQVITIGDSTRSLPVFDFSDRIGRYLA